MVAITMYYGNVGRNMRHLQSIFRHIWVLWIHFEDTLSKTFMYMSQDDQEAFKYLAMIISRA